MFHVVKTIGHTIFDNSFWQWKYSNLEFNKIYKLFKRLNLVMLLYLAKDRWDERKKGFNIVQVGKFKGPRLDVWFVINGSVVLSLNQITTVSDNATKTFFPRNHIYWYIWYIWPLNPDLVTLQLGLCCPPSNNRNQPKVWEFRKELFHKGKNKP